MVDKNKFFFFVAVVSKKINKKNLQKKNDTTNINLCAAYQCWSQSGYECCRSEEKRLNWRRKTTKQIFDVKNLFKECNAA